MRRKFPFVSVLEFRCCRVIPSGNHKLTSKERISCIRRHDDLSPRSHWAVSLQVAPLLRDYKDRGYRRRAGQMENEWVYSLWFKLISNWDFNGKNFFNVSAALPYYQFYSFARNAATVLLRQGSRVSLLQSNSLSKPQANFWRKNQLYHEARWFVAEKLLGGFTASCSFPQRL